MTFSTMGWMAEHVGPNLDSRSVSSLAAGLLVAKHADQFHVAWPGQDTIAGQMPIGRQAVNRAIAKLRDEQYLQIHHFRDRYGHLQCVYRFRVPHRTEAGHLVLVPVGRNVRLPDGVRWEDLPDDWRTTTVVTPDDPCVPEATRDQADAPDAPHGPAADAPDTHTDDTPDVPHGDTGSRGGPPQSRADSTPPVDNTGAKSPRDDKDPEPLRPRDDKAPGPSRLEYAALSPPVQGLVASSGQELPPTSNEQPPPPTPSPAAADATVQEEEVEKVAHDIATALHRDALGRDARTAIAAKLADGWTAAAIVRAAVDQAPADLTRPDGFVIARLARHDRPPAATEPVAEDPAVEARHLAATYSSQPWEHVEEALRGRGFDPDVIAGAHDTWRQLQREDNAA